VVDIKVGDEIVLAADVYSYVKSKVKYASANERTRVISLEFQPLILVERFTRESERVFIKRGNVLQVISPF
jgi:hypothetical protein